MINEEVLGVREDRTYETPALNSAKGRAKKYWKQAEAFGPIAFDSKTQAILNQEHKSVGQLFYVMARMSLSKPTEFTRHDGGAHGTMVLVEEPGGRRWDQRALAISAQMSVNTARKAMKRLQQLGLIWFETVLGRCTYVFVEGIRKFTRTAWWRSVIDSTARKKKISDASEGQKKSVSTSDTFPPSPNVSRTLTSIVDVPTPESNTTKVRSAAVQAEIDKIIGR